MMELLQEYSTRVSGPDGTTYVVRSYAEERAAGTWTGWLEFHPTDAGKPVLRTDHETSQPNREAAAYWATGLELIYFEGALARARVKRD